MLWTRSLAPSPNDTALGTKFYREMAYNCLYTFVHSLKMSAPDGYRFPDFLALGTSILDCERKMISQLTVNASTSRLAMITALGGLFFSLLLVSTDTIAEEGYVGDQLVEIQRVSQGKFRYPRSALRREIEGEVTIEFTVGVTGEVVDAFVVEATPPNRFEKNALKYVRSWVYEPLRINGVPTEVQRIETKVLYRLQ